MQGKLQVLGSNKIKLEDNQERRASRSGRDQGLQCRAWILRPVKERRGSGKKITEKKDGVVVRWD